MTADFISDLKRRSELVKERRKHVYDGPPMGQRPDTNQVFELASLFLGGKGYWYCTSCWAWHEDDGV